MLFTILKLLSAGVLLLEEVVNSFGSEGIYAIIDAMRERFNESEREKAAGSAAWWRVSKGFAFLCIYSMNSSICNLWPMTCSWGCNTSTSTESLPFNIFPLHLE
jgi:hypothetical protein